VALVRQVLGEIDVDPASHPAAQEPVQARPYYTMAEDGRSHAWMGTVFGHPPDGMPLIARLCGKLLEDLDAGHTTEAILLTHGVTDTGWFHRVAPRAAAICFTVDRRRFAHATRDSLRPCQGQAVFYFGPHAARFREVFGTLGLLMQVIGPTAVSPQLTLAEAPPTPPEPPPLPPLPEGMKLCGNGHAPYPATKRECPACVRERKRAHRQRQAGAKE
jgi:hypothetical protein